MSLLVAGSDEIYKSSIASHSHENKTDSNSKYQSLYILMLLSFDNQYATQMVFNNDVIGFLILYLSENKFNPHNPIEKEFPILSRRIIRNITSFGIYIYIYSYCIGDTIPVLISAYPNLIKSIISWIPKQLSSNVITDGLHIIKNVLNHMDIRNDCIYNYYYYYYENRL